MTKNVLKNAVAVALCTVAGSASAFVPASDPNTYPLNLPWDPFFGNTYYPKNGS